MLIGEYRHTIDSKKRFAVPAKLRKDLGERAVITRGLDSCLFLYSMEEWQKQMDKLSALPMGVAANRSFARFMLSGASEVEFDQLGRILIPDFLKEYANLKKNLVIVGVQNRLEIWDDALWKEFRSKAESNADELAEKLGAVGAY
jgi:MraZ protein